MALEASTTSRHIVSWDTGLGDEAFVYCEMSLEPMDMELKVQKDEIKQHCVKYHNEACKQVAQLCDKVSALNQHSIEYKSFKAQITVLNQLLESDDIDDSVKKNALTSLAANFQIALLAEKPEIDFWRFITYLNFSKSNNTALIEEAESSLLEEAKVIFRATYTDQVDDSILDTAAHSLGYFTSSEQTAECQMPSQSKEQFQVILADTISPGAIIAKIALSLSEKVKTAQKTQNKTQANEDNNKLIKTLRDNAGLGKSPDFTTTSVGNSILLKPKELTKLYFVALAEIVFPQPSFIFDESVEVYRPNPVLSNDTETSQPDSKTYFCHSDLIFCYGNSSASDPWTCCVASQQLPTTHIELSRASNKHQLLYHRNLLLSTAGSTSFIKYLRQLDECEQLPLEIKNGIKAMIHIQYKDRDDAEYVADFPPKTDFEFMKLAQIIEVETLCHNFDKLTKEQKKSDNIVNELIKLLPSINTDLFENKKLSLIITKQLETLLEKVRLSDEQLFSILNEIPSHHQVLTSLLQKELFAACTTNLSQISSIEELTRVITTISRLPISEAQTQSVKEVCSSQLAVLLKSLPDEDIKEKYLSLTNNLDNEFCKKLHFDAVFTTHIGHQLQNASSIQDMDALLTAAESIFGSEFKSELTSVQQAYIEKLVVLPNGELAKLNMKRFEQLASSDNFKTLWNTAINDDNLGLLKVLSSTIKKEFYLTDCIDSGIKSALQNKSSKCFTFLLDLHKSELEQSHEKLNSLIFLAIASSDIDHLNQLSQLKSFTDASKLKKDGFTPFLQSINDEHNTVAKWFIDRYPVLIFDTTDSYQNCIHIACHKECIDTLKAVLAHEQYSEIIDDYDSDGFSPLLLASKHSKTEAVKCLLSAEKLDVESEHTISGQNALHFAVKAENKQLQEALISQSKSLIYHADKDENTPLGIALNQKDFDQLDHCIELQKDLDFTKPVCEDMPLGAVLCRDGIPIQGQWSTDAIEKANLDQLYGESESTILHLAACSGSHFETLAARASIEQLSARDHRGLAPIHISAIAGKVLVFKKLVSKGVNKQTLDLQGRNVFYYSIKSGQIEFTKIAARKGVKLKTKDQDETMLMRCSVEHNQADMLNHLLTESQYKHFFEQCLNNDSLNLVMVAAEHNASKVIKTLPITYIQKCFESTSQFTPFMLAAKMNHYETVAAMISNYPLLLLSTTEEGLTAAHIAVKNNSIETLQAMQLHKSLLSQTIDAKSSAFYSYTPLMYAASLNKKDICKLLLEQVEGAQPQVNNQGLNAAHIAVKHNSVDAIQAFPKAMLDKCISDKGTSWSGYTCLHIAAYIDSAEMTRQLIKLSASLSISAYSNGDLAYVPLIVGIIKGSNNAVFEILQHTEDLSILFSRNENDMSEKLLKLKQSGFNNKRAVSKYAFELLSPRISKFNFTAIRHSVWSKFNEFNPQ